ncbi:MAG: multidrug effflux MFS transporter [Acetobacteraceae bacterium]|nr:multidrug effflux MFS transporter [Acetobacteraceae bacterium]
MLITAIGPFSLQIIVPAIPGLASSFSVPAPTAQLTLTVYLLGVALGQLAYGPLSDRYGRRPMAIAGLVVFLAASVLGTLASSIGGLVAARALQALGACSGMVLARAMIRDCYPRDRSASVMAYVFMGMTVAPMIAPMIGALLDGAFGWRALIAVPGLFGLLLFGAVIARLPETLRREAGAPHGPFGDVVMASLGLLRAPAFGVYAGCFAASSAVFFAFLGGAPFVVVRGLGLPATAYGVAFAVISVSYAAGNFVTARLAMRLGVRRLLAAGTALTFVAAAAALLMVLTLPPAMVNIFGPAMLMAFGNGVAQANAMAGAVSVRPQAAGAASGLAGAIQMAAGAVATVAVAALETGSGVATAGLMLGAACLCQAILFLGRRIA